MSPRVLVVQHEESCPPGLFGEWLAGAGLTLEVCRADLGEEIGPLKEYAGLLVLGGPMDADADESCPWLPVVRERIAEAARAGVPTLGICLGHQLAALALGGGVGRNPYGRTLGLRQVDWEPAVIFDPLVRGMAGEDRAMHANQDVVLELPPGAELLATTLDGQVQAARLAPTVWGVQFHPEADAAIVTRWGEADRETPWQRNPEEVADEVRRAEPELRRTWQPLAAAFAALVQGRVGAVQSFGALGRAENE